MTLWSEPIPSATGELVLQLEPIEDGKFIVRSPLDPQLLTEADSIADAFASARDALASLEASRAKLYEQIDLAAG